MPRISLVLISQWAQTMASSHAWLSINILIPKVSTEYSETEPSAMDCTVPSHHNTEETYHNQGQHWLVGVGDEGRQSPVWGSWEEEE